MLEYLENRFQRIGFEMAGVATVIAEGKEQKSNPSRVHIHEKERQFMDAFKLIIQSGYTVDEKDFIHILEFINIREVLEELDYGKMR